MEKARAAKSPEELLKIAHDNGQPEFTEENAEAYYAAIQKSGELADDEIDVSAGNCCAVRVHGQKMVSYLNYCDHFRCGYANDVLFKLKRREKYLPEEQLKVDLITYDGHYFHQHRCETCYYCSYERGAWWCNNEKHYSE